MPKLKKPNSSKKNQPRKKSTKKTSIFTAKFFFIVGLTLLSIYGLWTVNQLTKYSFAYQPVAHASKKGLPTFIAIKDNNIFLPVKETIIQNGVWQISGDGASHLATSSRPGENGTIIVYGHNTLAEFGSLPFISIGETIVVSTADGKTYTYTVTKTVVVDPTDVSVLKNQHGETLVLYTCYGFADLKRFVVVAKPQL